MKLYVWDSNALKQYGTGTICALGNDMESAKAHALRAYEEYLHERYDWLFSEYSKDDEDNQQYLQEMRDSFAHDLMEEPRIIDYAIVIPGSQ